MYKFNLFDKITFILVLVGAINWGLVGLGNFDLIEFTFSFIPLVQRIFYVIIGLAGLNIILLMFKAKVFGFKAYSKK
jgi:uncharacterized membrane protein YuzA (DUF378 family)